MTDGSSPDGGRGFRREARLWGSGIVAAVAVAVGLPLWLEMRGAEDPAADAEATYRALLLRIEAREAATETAAAEPADGPVPTNRRDLFSPVRERRPGVATERARRKRPKLPALTGVLIDGPSRQAVLDGHIVAAGELAGDWRVERIETDAVTLRRDGTLHRLTMGDDR